MKKMLNDTIVNQLQNLKGNIEWMDVEQVESALLNMPSENLEIIQNWIGELNRLLVDGKINI